MGSRLIKFKFKPEENEQMEAIIKIPKESRSIIHGIIKNSNDKLIENAVVKLYETTKSQKKLKPLTHTFTDECGQFIFGPLCSNKQYVIKIWINDVKIRHVIINPDTSDTCVCQNMQDDIDFEIDDDKINSNSINSTIF